MTQFEYYSHNKMSQVKKDFTPTLIKELKSFLVERMVDNMETKDLVEYVTDDLDDYFESLPDEQFINEAKNYWDDSFDDEEVQGTWDDDDLMYQYAWDLVMENPDKYRDQAWGEGDFDNEIVYHDCIL